MWEKELEAAIEAGVAAIEGILKIYNTDFDVEIKEDNSPVTLADKNADKVIREHLHSKFPTYAPGFRHGQNLPAVVAVSRFEIRNYSPRPAA